MEKTVLASRAGLRRNNLSQLIQFRGTIHPPSCFLKMTFKRVYFTIKRWLLSRPDSNLSSSFPKNRSETAEAPLEHGAWFSIIFKPGVSCSLLRLSAEVDQEHVGGGSRSSNIWHFSQTFYSGLSKRRLLWRDLSFRVLVIAARHKAAAAGCTHTMMGGGGGGGGSVVTIQSTQAI